MHLDRLGRILRARRHETARGRPPGTDRLICVDSGQHPGAYDRSRPIHRGASLALRIVSVTIFLRLWKSRTPPAGPTAMRYSPAGSEAATSAAITRSLRLHRLRATELPTLRPTEYATRTGSLGSPASKQCTVIGPPRTRRPCLNSSRNLLLPWTRGGRPFRRRASRVRAGDGLAGSPVRPASTFGGESRGASPACAGSVGTSVSSHLFSEGSDPSVVAPACPARAWVS